MCVCLKEDGDKVCATCVADIVEPYTEATPCQALVQGFTWVGSPDAHSDLSQRHCCGPREGTVHRHMRKTGHENPLSEPHQKR